MSESLALPAALPRVLVLGANGRLGRSVVAEALQRGAEVTAFVRSVEGLPLNARLKLVRGSVTDDRRSLTRAVQGQDAVISALGNPLWLKGLKGPAIMEKAIGAITAAMRESGVGRIAVPLAWGTGASADVAGPIVRLIAATLIRRDYKDFSRAEELLVSSGLDWTIGYFGALTDSPSGHWAPVNGMGRPRALSIARSDVAEFLVDAVLGDRHVRRRVVLDGAAT